MRDIILGGGISGLSVAYFMQNDESIVIEKDRYVGGYCKTTMRGEYVWDYAGHFYHFKTPEFLKWFMNEIPESERVFNVKNTKIVLKDCLIDYPFQTNIHQLTKDDLIYCVSELYGSPQTDFQDDSFLSMLYSNYGAGIVNLFLRPYNEKLYACDLNALDKNAMGRFFPVANKTQIADAMKGEKTNTYNDTFWYPKKGAQTFVDLLKTKCETKGVLIKTDETVTGIDLEKRIVSTNKGNYEYDHLINTLPLNEFCALAKGIPDELIPDFSYNKILVFNLGFKDRLSEKSMYRDVHWIYVPEKKYNFYRVGFYNNILHSDKVSLYIEIGFSMDEEINLDSELKCTIDGLKELNIISESNSLVDYQSIVMQPAYVHINTKAQNKVDLLMKQLEQKGVYSIGRYGAWTYCSMEDCMLQGKNVASKLCKRG